jgi:hypothetical protein
MSFVAQPPSAVNTTFTYTTGAAEANLYDGNDATPAADPSGITASMRAAYDFGSAKQIERCRVISASVNGLGHAVTFNVRYSDTSLTAGFLAAGSITVAAGTSQAAVQTFTPVGAHRYWDIAYASGTTGGNAWLGELTFYTQLLDTVAYIETGNAAAFSITAPSVATSYSFTGNAAQFAAMLGSNTAPYIETGNAAAFRSTFPVIGTAYTLTGNAAPLTPKMNSGPAAFVMTGYAMTTWQTWSAAGAPYLVTGIDAPLTRNFINWLGLPFTSSLWGSTANPSSTWTPAASPSTAWTGDPAQVIPPPTSS